MPLSETKLFSRIDSRVSGRETQKKKKHDGPRQKALAPEAQPGPCFVALAAVQRHPQSRGRGSAGGSKGLFEACNSLTGARRVNRSASRVRLSASAGLTAARIAPDRLGRSDVKFHLSDSFFFNVVVGRRLLFGAAPHCPGVLLFSRSRKSCHSAFFHGFSKLVHIPNEISPNLM